MDELRNIMFLFSPKCTYFMYNKGKPLKSNTMSCLKIQPPSLWDSSSRYGAGKSGGRKRKERCDCSLSSTIDIKFPFPKCSVKCVSLSTGSPSVCVVCVVLLPFGFGVGPQWLKTDALFFCSCLAGESNGQSRAQDSESINEIYCDTMKWAREAISTRRIPVI